MAKHRLHLLALVLMLMLAAFAAGCGGDDDDEAGGDTGAADTGGGEASDVSGEVSVISTWSGPEQASFEEVIAGFNEQYPDVDVSYDSAGDALPTVLSTAVEGGNPPDVAVVAQPGLIQGYVERGVLQPIDFAQETIAENFGESVIEVGTFDEQLYALLFKAANKSTVWYNVSAFEDAGVEPADNWDDFLANAETVKASGLPAYSIGGAEGWTLTDLFENIYLRTAGGDMYDQLSRHEIPWTDQSVKDALTEMAKVVGDTDNIVGGTQGALQSDFPTSVSNVFAEEPKAAMVIEGDFVPGVVESPLEAETGYNVFAFPSVNDSPPSVVGGGDLAIMFNDTPAAQAFIEYLATPEAAEIWAGRGGFSSANQNVDSGVYPDPITETTASAIAEAEEFRFDLSDLQPSEFGSTEGQGMWKLFQDFVANPDDVDGIAQKLEAAAAAAYGQ
ncbi:MAG TPA: extracellular solute-binding protein [Gaiellaceae bacterium]|jgi:alpha-glucoside transport system substrate-binding protein|nr:extracellular solute-binding protein [Gaiellaceae bacterium]